MGCFAPHFIDCLYLFQNQYSIFNFPTFKISLFDQIFWKLSKFAQKNSLFDEGIFKIDTCSKLKPEWIRVFKYERKVKGETCSLGSFLTCQCSYISRENSENPKKSWKFPDFCHFRFRFLRFLMILDHFSQKHTDAFLHFFMMIFTNRNRYEIFAKNDIFWFKSCL